MGSNNKIRNYLIIIVPILLAIILYGLSFTPFVQNSLNQISDFKFRKIPLNNAPNKDIILIAIDDSSLRYFQENGISYPWPRVFYAKMLDFLEDAGAKAVFFDMFFNEQDLSRDEIDSAESDGAFAQSIQKMESIYLASQMNDDKRFNSFNFENCTIDVLGSTEKISSYQGMITPIPSLLSVAKSGYVNIFPDNDGVIREVKLLAKIGDKIIPSLILKMYADIVKADKIAVFNNYLEIDSQRIPVDSEMNFTVSWYKDDDFSYIPIKALIQSASAKEYGFEQTLESDIFRDKIILIGATASGLMDNRSVPINENLPGIEIWASAIGNLLNNDFMGRISSLWNLIFLFFISMIIILLSFFPKKIYSYISIIVFFALLVIIDLFCWKFFHVQIDIISFFASVILTYTIVQAAQYIGEIKYRKRLKKTFGRYLNDNLVDYISKNDSELQMGGKESEISVLYSDIYDFTTLSEKMQPTEIVTMLNEYFNDLTSFVLGNDGLLDKYTGDGIMAVFGSPLPDKMHAKKACVAMMEYKKFCNGFRDKIDRTFTEQIHLNTRLAINSGIAVTGNIGSTKRMDFTAIGDTVNLAARLEGVNKLYGTNYLISEDTYKFVKDDFSVRKLDCVMVKGRKTATTIYELLGYSDFSKSQEILDYEEALKLYEKKEWVRAIGVLQKNLSDNPSQRLHARITKLIKDNPKDWNFVLKLYEK